MGCKDCMQACPFGAIALLSMPGTDIW
ncbi:MAG: 4Fe-4S binding protein [Clostridium sp.]